MKKINIGIVTDDGAYGQALARGIRYRARKSVINVFSSGGFTEKWKKGGLAYRRSFDVILWDGPDGSRIRGDNILWITDRCGSAEDSIIYRYDTASEIYGRLMDACEKRDKEAPAMASITSLHSNHEKRGEETRVTFFGACRGGSGCSLLCREIAEELVRFFGKRVMWLSLDGIEPGRADLSRNPSPRQVKNVDYYLYRTLGTDDESTSVDIDRFILKDGYGVEFLAPSLGRNPLPLLSRSDASRFMRIIADSRIFDGILIDGGDCCSESAAVMMALADRICLVAEDPDDEKTKRYMNWMRNTLDEDGEDRVTLISERGKLNGNNIHALAETLWYNEMDRSM